MRKADSVIIVDEGKIVAFGKPEDVLTEKVSQTLNVSSETAAAEEVSRTEKV